MTGFYMEFIIGLKLVKGSRSEKISYRKERNIYGNVFSCFIEKLMFIYMEMYFHV